jgi:ankyrin repeat protein
LTVRYPLRLSLSVLILAGLFCAAQDSADQKLFQAVANGDMGAVRVLLANRADLQAKDARGDTALMLAVSARNIRMVKLLLEPGADISGRNNDEDTVLIEAARSMDPEMLRVFLEQNSDIQEKHAALFAAAHSAPVVIQIPDAPAMPAASTQQSARPAAKLPWVTSLRLLLDIGAKINVGDKQGMTPLIATACACAVATMNSITTS